MGMGIGIGIGLPRSRVLLLIVFAALASARADRILAQEKWSWPEKGKNLQVLPKDFPAERLQAVMKGFTRSLGVRCQYCHVGEEGKPLSTFDFVSDANPNKARAREMYRMLGDINGHLKKIQPSGDKRVNMWCHTCHAGRPRPMTLGEELEEAQRHGGVAASLRRYRELKERFYGKAGYDFSESALEDFGRELLDAKDAAGAVDVFQANAQAFPGSGDAQESLADGYRAAGKAELARAAYRRAVELDPHNEAAARKLRELEPTSD